MYEQVEAGWTGVVVVPSGGRLSRSMNRWREVGQDYESW